MSTYTDAELYRHKLTEAKRLIDTHNYLRKPTKDDTRVVYENFVHKLVAMGGINNEMLVQTTAEDLEKSCDLPVLMARRLAEIFQDTTISVDLQATEGWKLAHAMRNSDNKGVL